MSIQIKLQHGLYNAGVLGFYNILQFANKSHYLDYKKGSNIIYIDEKCLGDFENDYYNYLAFKYSEQLSIHKILSSFELLDFDNLDERMFKEWVEQVNSRLKSASYKSGYVIIEKYREDSTDVLVILKQLKASKSLEEKKQLALNIYQYLKKHIDVFTYKNLAYSIINNYWEGISFFGTANVKKEMTLEYKREFVDGALAVVKLQVDKGKNICSLCKSKVSKKKINKTDVLSNISTWLIDQGVDYKRKSSYFWNFKPDGEVCGLCKLIYSCIPAGFYNFYNNGMFINMSSSIDDLIRFNNPEGNIMAKDGYEAHQDKSYGYIMNSMTSGMDKIATKMTMNNVQLIKRDNRYSDTPKYYIEYLGTHKLHLLQQCVRYINYYKQVKLKVNDQYRNIYMEIMDAIVNNQNLYPLLREFLFVSLKNKHNIKLYNIIKVQAIQSTYRKNSKRGEAEKMVEKSLNKIYVVYYKGIEIRDTLEGTEEEKNNKLRGFIYQLTNALQANNTSMFMDRVVRLYSSLTKGIPTLFIDVLKDQDDFMNYGYAFIIGLKGERMKKEEV